MNRSDLIVEIMKKTGQTKKAVTEFVTAYEECVCEAMCRNDTVALHGFLKIERRKRKGHKGNDLNNAGLIDIPEKETVKATPGNKLKECFKEQ